MSAFQHQSPGQKTAPQDGPLTEGVSVCKYDYPSVQRAFMHSQPTVLIATRTNDRHPVLGPQPLAPHVDLVAEYYDVQRP